MDRGRHIPLTTQLLGWVASASTLVTCCRKWSAQSRRVLGVRSALLGQRYARLELKGQIGVVVVGWDWGTEEWAKSSTLLSCGAAFGTVL
jgi:hypothetical protein